MANLASATLGQTSNANPIQSFTPEKQSPNFSGVINQLITLTTKTGAGVTLTAAEVLGGLIIHDTSSAAVSDTLPTAALLVPLIEGAKVGTAVRFTIRNSSAGAGTLTVVAGTGGTVSGTATIAFLNQKEFLLRVTAIGATPTYTVYSLGTVVF